MTAKKPPGVGFQLDVCHDCEWTWFDGGELAKSQLAVEQAPVKQGNEVCSSCGARFRLWATNNIGRLRHQDDGFGSQSNDDYKIDVCPSCGVKRPSKPFWESVTDWWRSFCEYG
jgi:Zn-finger nucleic acid-binding protein